MRNLRIRMGYTQKQLGIRIGVTQAYISRIERGDIQGLSIGKLVKISQILKVTPPHLLEVLLKQNAK